MSEYGEPTLVHAGRDSAGLLRARISTAAHDPEWDAFIESVPAGHYTQTSAWGRCRAYVGWDALRVMLVENGRPVGGMQIETKSLPVVGKVGFAYGGPVVADGDVALEDAVIEEAVTAARREGLRYLAVRPPRGADAAKRSLAAREFARGMLDHLYVSFEYSVMLDLSPGPDAVFAGFSKKRRQNIRAASRRGVVVRHGGAADLPVFGALEDAHAARLGYERRDDGYFERLWNHLRPDRHVELFIAEYHGLPICAQLVIPFGDTTYHIERPWSGEFGDLGAAELVEWEALRWAMGEGYARADLGGIDAPVARSVLTGAADPAASRYGASWFKLKWGGHIVEEPPFMDYVFEPASRFVYRHLPSSVMRLRVMERLAKRLKERGS